jgi:uncharacterized protein YegL
LFETPGRRNFGKEDRSMSNPFENTEGIAKRTMVLFFLVDTSGSMAGKKIGAVNDAIFNVLPEIRTISEDNADAEIKIAALTFSNGAKWLYDEPKPAKEFDWPYVDADGMTDLGAAYHMLNEKLSRSAFMNDVEGSYAPAIFLMTDGQPTDDYQKELEKLNGNKWFHVAIKVAVAIGEESDVNDDVLTEFTGTSEAVLRAHTPEALAKMIRLVSVTASKIGSQSSTVGQESRQETFTEELNKQEQEWQPANSAVDVDEGWD